MPFTVKDFQSLLRLLERQPQWKNALRAALVGEEFLELPSLLRSLVQAQRATQRGLRALAESHRSTQQELRALADTQARTEQEVRTLIQELRALADAQARLAEAQAGTDQRVARLEDAIARLTEVQQRGDERGALLERALARLVEAQAGTDQRVARLEEAVARLTDAQERTERELAEFRAQADRRFAHLEDVTAHLVEAQRRTEETLQTLVQTVTTLVGEVGALKGENLERRYRERAASYFQRILRRIRLVDHQQLGLLLDDALDQGRITPEERAQVLEADVVVAGLADGQEVYLLAEVSSTVTSHDVRRARARAQALEKATGRPVLPVVAGERLSEDRETQEEAWMVWRVLDGRVMSPSPTDSP